MFKDAFLHNLPAYQTQFYIICLGGRGLQFKTAIGHGYVSRLNLIVHCLTSFNFYIVSEISSYTYVRLIVPAPLLPGCNQSTVLSFHTRPLPVISGVAPGLP
jgi:hypothetical protein